MSCPDIRDILGRYGECVETESGSRVITHCLYPSFEPVYVFVARVGDGFKIHDGGGAYKSAWDHGRDASLASRSINRQATTFGLKVGSDDALIAEIETTDWLLSGILAVANASASAAHAAFNRVVTATEDAGG